MQRPPSRATAGQQTAWATTYATSSAHFAMDDSFSKVKSAVESHLGLLGRQAQVKIKNWLRKLSEEVCARMEEMRN